MVKHCVESGELMAVACAGRALGEKPAMKGTREQVLSSNQQSYEPAIVFSAGSVRILQEFEDGRYLIELTAQGRFRLKNWVQQVPFLVGECESFSTGSIGEEKWQSLKQRMKLLLGDHFESLDKDLLSGAESAEIKFFHLLSRFQWPADEVQRFLELERADDMADSLLKTLEGVQLVPGVGETPPAPEDLH